jgi:hypothetical protein
MPKIQIQMREPIPNEDTKTGDTFRVGFDETDKSIERNHREPGTVEPTNATTAIT